MFYISDVEILKEILSHLKNTSVYNFVNAADKDGVTPIMQRIVRGSSAAILNALLESGAEPCTVDKKGWSTLHYAGKYHADYSIMRKHFLASCHSLIDVQNVDGMTALHLAVGTHFYDGIVLLLDAGANPFVRDAEDKTPRERAVEGWYIGDNPYYAPYPYGEAVNGKPFNRMKASIVRLLDAREKELLTS